MPMKTYEVEYTRTVFVYYTVEALDEDSAEEKAWEELREDQSRSTWDLRRCSLYPQTTSNWEVESVKETNEGEMK